MKKLLLILCLMPILAFAGINLGIKKQDEYISYAIFCVDSNGVDRAPDSAQVITYLDQNGLATAFTTRSTTYPFPIGIDTSKIYADTTYYFSDQIQDIDGTPSPATVYTLAVDVILWTKAIATHNPAVVQVIPDSLDNYLVRLDAAVSTRSTFAAATDSVIVDGSALAATANAITATTMANDVIGSNELAATAIDEFWETDTNTVTTASSFGKAIKNVIDTTKAVLAEVLNIDAWNPITSSESLVVAMTPFNTEIIDVNVEQINTNATAADNEAESWDDDNVGGILDLKQLAVRATTAEDTAVIFESKFGGPGLFIRSDSSDAVWITTLEVGAGLTGVFIDANQDGLKIDAGNRAMVWQSVQPSNLNDVWLSDVIVATIDLDSIHTRKSVLNRLTIDSMLVDTLTIDSLRVDTLVATAMSAPFITTGDSVRIDGSTLAATSNSITELTIAAGTITAVKIAADATEKIANRVIPRKLGTITSVPTTTTFRASAFTEADGYWTDNMVYFLNGTAERQVARIDTFVASVDSFKLAPALSVAPSVGDSIVVFSILAQEAAAGADASPSAWDATDTAIARAVVWEALLATYDNVLGSFGDSAGGWGATSAGGTDTANILLAFAHNPNIVSGREVGYWGTVAGTTPSDFGFVVAGANFDLTQVNDYYNGWDLKFYSGGWKNQRISIADWITATDSLVIDTLPSAVRSASTPAIGDSFTISPSPIVDLYEWSGQIVSEANQHSGQNYFPQTDIHAVSNDPTAANNLESAFDGVGYYFQNSIMPRVEGLDSLHSVALLQLKSAVADTGQDLNWDSVGIGSLGAAEIADSVLDNILAGHSTLGSVGAVLLGLVTVQDSVRFDATNGVSCFKTALAEATNTHYNGQTLVFLTGANAHHGRFVFEYDGITKFICVNPDLSVIPASGDRFVILGNRNPVEPDTSIGAFALNDDAIGTNAVAANAIGAGDIATNAITATQIATDAAEEIANRVIARKLGTVTSAPTTTTFRASAFTEADGYWTNNVVYFLNGTAQWQSARVDTFVASVDSFKLAPALSVAPTIGDSFVVFSMLAEEAAAGAGGNPAGGYIDSVIGGSLPFGQYVRGFYVIDTSGTHDSIPGVAVSFLSNGINRGTFTTDADGFFKIIMPAGTWTAVASRGGYVFIDTTFTISVSDTLDIRGSNLPPPAAAATPEFVRAYIDVAEARIDSLTGQMVPYTQIEMILNLQGNPSAFAGGFAIIPREYKEKPNASGRVIFDIPATTVMDPDGCYYILTYRTRVGQSVLSGDLGAFIVDTLPDPLNIIEAIQVWNQEH